MSRGNKTNDARAMLLHRELAEYHRDIAIKARTDIKYRHHLDLATRLNEEADHLQELIVFEEENLWQDPST